MKRTLVCLLIALALAGCSKSAKNIRPSATPTAGGLQGSPAPAVFPTIPPVTPTSSASPTPFTPFKVKPAVDNLKVRVGPGLLFEAMILVQQADELTVQGMSPGGEWVYIQTAGGTEGWVFSQLLKSDVDLSQVPVREPKGTVVVRGRVTDAGGTPIQGVGFDVSQNTGGEALSTTVVTDSSGTFYAFLPDTASGNWSVNYTAIACKSNVWSDATCGTYKSGYTGAVDPITQSATLPQGNNILLFTWR